MKKTLVLVILATMLMAMAMTADATRKISGLGFADDFKYKDDSRFSATLYDYGVDQEYGLERYDMYLYIGDQFYVHQSNMKDTSTYVIEFVRRTDNLDYIWWQTEVNAYRYSIDFEDIEKILMEYIDKGVKMIDEGLA